MLHRLQDLMAGWYDMPLAKIDQFISNEAFLFFISQMCFEKLVLSCCFLILNEEIWLLWKLLILVLNPLFFSLSGYPYIVFSNESAEI